MLLCVVTVFFIFNILAMVVNIFEAANILVDEMTRVSNLLVSVNSSVNFIIYCIFGDKFQRLFLRHFCCCFRPKPRSLSGESQYNTKLQLFFYETILSSRTELSWFSRKFYFDGQYKSTHGHSKNSQQLCYPKTHFRYCTLKKYL